MMGLTRAAPLRLAAVLAGAALALWITMGVTLTLTMARSRPAVALAIWPWGATALASEAARAVDGLTPDRARLGPARTDAGRALKQEPGNIVALRVLGIVQAMEAQPDAPAYFIAAERFSRRDLLVQLALIESAVTSGDVEAAITHYDRALRTGYRAYDLLFPVLVGASADPAIARPLGRKLAARPAWWNAFVERAVQASAPNPMLGWLVRQVRLRTDRPTERPFLVAAMQRLVEQGDIADARLLYRDARGATLASAAIRDRGFERDDQLAPFEWELTDNADLAAVRESGEHGGTRLRLVANGGREGLLARQLLALAPGFYRLSLTAGDAAGGGFSSRVTCVGERGGMLIDLVIAAPAGGRGRPAGGFAVPAGCHGQWLSIVGGSPDAAGTQTSSPWIDDMTIGAVHP